MGFSEFLSLPLLFREFYTFLQRSVYTKKFRCPPPLCHASIHIYVYIYTSSAFAHSKNNVLYITNRPFGLSSLLGFPSPTDVAHFSTHLYRTLLFEHEPTNTWIDSHLRMSRIHSHPHNLSVVANDIHTNTIEYNAKLKNNVLLVRWTRSVNSMLDKNELQLNHIQMLLLLLLFGNIKTRIKGRHFCRKL